MSEDELGVSHAELAAVESEESVQESSIEETSSVTTEPSEEPAAVESEDAGTQTDPASAPGNGGDSAVPGEVPVPGGGNGIPTTAPSQLTMLQRIERIEKQLGITGGE